MQKYTPQIRNRGAFHNDLCVSSETEIVVYKDYADPSLMSRKPGDEDLTADRIGRLAVEARTLLRAGRIKTKTLRVDRSGNISRALHCRIDIVADLVHADDEDNVLGALGDRGNSVGIAVNVYEDAVISHGVAACEEIVSIVGHEHGLPLVLICIAVDEIIVSVLERLRQADLMNAHSAAH